MKNSIYIILILILFSSFYACQNETSANQKAQVENSKNNVQTSTTQKVNVGADLRLESNCIKNKARFEENKKNYIRYQIDRNGSVAFSGSVDGFDFNGVTEKLTDRIRVGDAYFKLEFILDIKCQFVKGVRLRKTGEAQNWDITKFTLERSLNRMSLKTKNRNKLIMLLFILFPIISHCQINSPIIQLTDLEGSWYINYSNFPMWLKGNKISPTFNYTLLTKNNNYYLIDEVKFTKKGKMKSIHGLDTPLNDDNSFFEWRGNGLLKILKSRWRIIYFDADNNWAIIYFEKTLFTPEGYDIISKKDKIPIEINSLMKQKLRELNINEELKEIIHE